MAVFIQNREEFEQRLVIMKTKDGWSIRALARHFAVSRNMVRRILRNHDNLRNQGHDILLTDRQVRKTERASKLDSYEETLKRLLEKYPRITGQRLFEEVRIAGYDGGISILRDRLRSLRPAPKKTPVIRFETEPGLHYGKEEVMLRCTSVAWLFLGWEACLLHIISLQRLQPFEQIRRQGIA